MNYLQLNFKVDNTDFQQMLIAELAQIEFEGFEEQSEQLVAFIAQNLFDQQALTDILERYKALFVVDYVQVVVEKTNWNALWESNYEPIVVGDVCLIRAPFHEIVQKYRYELIIEPKMSFGTGHHDTTAMMVEQLLKLDVSNKTVMDMGCGTGILGIFASMLGAKTVVGIDNEVWAIENTKENCERNGIKNFEAILGTANEIEGSFDIFLANINKNIILNDLQAYVDATNLGGFLVCSGFLVRDIEDIVRPKVGRRNHALC